MSRSTRHGAIPSSEFTGIIERSGNYIVVVRGGYARGAGPENSGCGLYSGITGELLMGIGGGQLPEYSFHKKPTYDCACSPGALCRTGAHGTELVRGWRNLLHEMLVRRFVRPTEEIRQLYGTSEVDRALDYGMSVAPSYRRVA